jgi:nitric oxide reductase NorQ protein
MNRIELDGLDINQLRAMARSAGLETTKKASIIAALADDYREGAPTIVDTPMADPFPARTPDHEAIIWPDVPQATSDVNGEYVTPPWYGELAASVQIGHVELMGPAGSGKTLAVHKLAAEQNRKLAVITADGGLRKRDLIGQRELLGGQTVHLASEFASAARDGHWALIDEANMAEADALGMLNGMLDRPGIGGSTFTVSGKAFPVHPAFRAFITRNPGYQGTKVMNEALRDRFWSIEVPPLLGESLETMFRAHGMAEAYLPTARRLIEALYSAWEKNRIAYQISPRRAMQASKMADLTEQPFPEVLARSILTKIDAKHERDAVKTIIDQVEDASRYVK